MLPTPGQKGQECSVLEVLEVNVRFCRTKFGNWILAKRNLVIAVLTLFRILEALCIGIRIAPVCSTSIAERKSSFLG